MLSCLVTGGPAIAEEASKAEKAKTNRCLTEAFNSVHIPGAETINKVNNDGLETHRNQAIVFHNDGKFVIATYAKVEEPGKKVSFSATHDGTKSWEVIDGTSAGISIGFNEDKVTERETNIHTQDLDNFNKEHGKWTVDAVQTMERTFTRCMGISDHETRPESAAESVEPAPPNSPPTNPKKLDL